MNYDSAITIDAQVRWYSKGRNNPERGGSRQSGDGYLIMLKKDLDAKAYVPMAGDNITSIAGTTVNLVVILAKPCMHYDGVAKGMQLNFDDRQPTRQ